MSAAKKRPSARGVTLKDIARALHIDHSTVGYALSGKGTVSDETRRRVEEAAARMGYVPHRAARQVRGERTSAIGLIVPNVLMGYAQFVQYASRLAHEAGMELHTTLSEFDHARERAAVDSMLESRVSGLILKTLYTSWNAVPKTHPLRTAAKTSLPIVLHGSRLKGATFAAVNISPESVGRALGEHLAARGAEHAAVLFHQAPPISGNARLIADGLGTHVSGTVRVVTMKKPPIATPAPEGVNLHYRRQVDAFLADGATGAARELLSSAMALSPRPDVLVCQNDLLALGVMAEMMRRGITPGKDIAVAATDRSLSASFAPVSLTTAGVDQQRVAQAAFGLLSDIIGGRADVATVIDLEPDLVIGEST